MCVQWRDHRYLFAQVVQKSRSYSHDIVTGVESSSTPCSKQLRAGINRQSSGHDGRVGAIAVVASSEQMDGTSLKKS